MSRVQLSEGFFQVVQPPTLWPRLSGVIKVLFRSQQVNYSHSHSRAGTKHLSSYTLSQGRQGLSNGLPVMSFRLTGALSRES